MDNSERTERLHAAIIAFADAARKAIKAFLDALREWLQPIVDHVMELYQEARVRQQREDDYDPTVCGRKQTECVAG